MGWTIPKLIIKGILKPRWPFCFLFGTTLFFLLVGYYTKEFQVRLILTLILQAIGVILISLWNIWPSSEARTRISVVLATLFGGSVGPAFISLTNAIGVGLVLAALFIQISEIISWLLIVMIIFSSVIVILGIVNILLS